MNIRRAQETDIGAIRQLLDAQNRLHTQLLPGFFQESPTTEERVRNVLENPQATFLVAEDAGEILGLIELHLTRTKDLPILAEKHYVHIGELIVAEASRRKGIGSRLIDEARSWAGELGARALRTSVVPANDAARAFYAKHGFDDIMISVESELPSEH